MNDCTCSVAASTASFARPKRRLARVSDGRYNTATTIVPLAALFGPSAEQTIDPRHPAIESVRACPLLDLQLRGDAGVHRRRTRSDQL